MPTIVTSRLIIVCPADQRDNVNLTLNSIAGTTGDDVMTSALCTPESPSSPIVGYWAGWGMDETTKGQVQSAIRGATWKPKLNAAELTVYTPPLSPLWGTQRVYLYDGSLWESAAILNALGLVPQQPIDIY